MIASQLISGGPGPNYQIRKSKLEPGVREINAVLLIPTFLPEMRMNMATNWFKLTDPEHLVHHTGKMMERGRKVQELRDAVYATCNAHQYRDADLRVLQIEDVAARRDAADAVDASSSFRSRTAPAASTCSRRASTALVPELTGFSGVDVITLAAAAPVDRRAAAATAGGARPRPGATPPTTFSVTSLATSPRLRRPTRSPAARRAIADVFVFGKYISLLDTRVIAGGRVASFEILSREVIHVQIPANVIPTTTEDGKTYIEVYLATPNGISNSLLIPYQAAAPPPSPRSATTWTTQSARHLLSVAPGADGKATLVPAADPSKNAITITWDSYTGLAPAADPGAVRRGGQQPERRPGLAGPAGGLGRLHDRRDGVHHELLHQLQTITAYPAIPSTPLTFTVTVQPWTPADSQGLRAETAPKTLPSKVTVNLQYNATGAPAQPTRPRAIPSGPGRVAGRRAR